MTRTKIAALFCAAQCALAFPAMARSFVAPSAEAQTISSAPAVSSVNGCTTTCTVAPGNFVGSFTVATLPTCNGTTTLYGSVAYATDLGGGANNVKCIGNSWQHFTLGTPANVTSTANLTITPLVSPPIMIMNNGALTNTQTLTLSTTNLYPGYMLYIRKPGVIGLLGSIGIQLSSGGTNLPIVGSALSVFVYDGTALQQIQ